MNQLLIGLHGLAGAGKDTAARYLAAHYHLLTYAFASPLKMALVMMLNLAEERLEGALKEAPIDWLGKSPRELMQLLGTEWGRDLVHPQLWLLLAERNLANLAETQARCDGFVISDVRFENEAAWVRQRGGIVVHLRRPAADAVNPHSSESGIHVHDNDLLIDNAGTLQELYAQLDLLMISVIRRTKHAA